MSPFSRRDLLKSGAALPFVGVPALPAVTRKADGVRNIIFMVSDGMSAGVPSLAEPFSRLVRGKRTQWHALADDPETVRGFLETASLDSMVTDSAAASSAWGSGSRVSNGAVNVLPDGTRLTPIAELARSSRRAVGLVTTTTITHATPAGFAAVEPSRDDQARIATQYTDSVDIALGGGREYFDAAIRPDGRDVFKHYRDCGYSVCTSRDEMSALPPDTRRVLGVFGTGHLPYTIDQINRPDLYRQVPTLAEMTDVALNRLIAAPDGFLLQIEGGRVDHAAHNNDAAGLLWDQLAFDDAIGVALMFVERHPDTLLVITTDHGNANPGLNGMGIRYTASTACFERIAGIRSSFVRLNAALGGGEEGTSLTAEAVIDVIRTHTDITLSPSEAEAVATARAGGVIADLNGQHTGIVGALGQALSNHIGVAWTGTSHTSELAITLATGRARENFVGIQHHTDVFGVLTGLMGVNHRNPVGGV